MQQYSFKTISLSSCLNVNTLYIVYKTTKKLPSGRLVVPVHIDSLATECCLEGCAPKTQQGVQEMSVLTSVEILAFITTVHTRHLSQCHWLEKALVSLPPHSHSKNNLNAILFSTHFFAPPPPPRDEGLVKLFRLILNSRFSLSFQNSCDNSGPLF